MSLEKTKILVKEKLSNSQIINFLDLMKKGEWSIILFAILILHSLRSYIANSEVIFRIDMFSLVSVLVIYPIILFLLNYILKINNIYSYFQNYILLTSLMYFMSSFLFFFLWGGLDVAISSFPYLCYIYNISFLYWNSKIVIQIESKKTISSTLKYLKIISALFHLISFIAYLTIGENDPLYITVFCCVTPFFIVSLFLRKRESLCFMYRLLFLVLFFFLSTIVTPYLLILGLLLMWAGKFYYFIKHGIKYPSFYNIYDIRQ